MPGSDLFVPPKPTAKAAVIALARTLLQGDGDLLSLLPREAFTMASGPLGYSRRSTILINDPDLVRQVLQDRDGVFPKSDLMVNALEPLIGDSIFVSDGEKWRRQRAMIDPAFSMMRVSVAFPAMAAAVDDQERALVEASGRGDPVSLDLVMSTLAADIICRTVFSTSLESAVAREVFEDFAVFERNVAQVKIWRLILDPAWTEAPQDPAVLAACARIRRHLGALIDTHLGPEGSSRNDIASMVIAARDSGTGAPFTREELIDQLGVFFLAGHETTASALTWAFYILAMRPEMMARVREEVSAAAGEEPVGFEHVRSLAFVRAFFKEVLRLYPPITFMPRVALRDTRVGDRKLKRGALVMVSPWTLHRRRGLWPDPDAFDPDRFYGDRERTIPDGAYIPFGAGPHTCVGAGFAAVESALILARLASAFDFEVIAPERVRPAARLTTRPAEQIMCHVRTRVRPSARPRR